MTKFDWIRERSPQLKLAGDPHPVTTASREWKTKRPWLRKNRMLEESVKPDAGETNPDGFREWYLDLLKRGEGWKYLAWMDEQRRKHDGIHDWIPECKNWLCEEWHGDPALDR